MSQTQEPGKKIKSSVSQTTEKTSVMPNQQKLPLFYASLVPLNSGVHQNIALTGEENYDFAADANSIPTTVTEAPVAQMFYPLVFTDGEDPVPVILTGLPQTGNRFVNESGAWKEGTYVPAYLRRYPFVLARGDTGGEMLNLCFDPSSRRICKKADAGSVNLFDEDKLTAKTDEILKFCENFEAAAQHTKRVMSTLKEVDLLIDGQAEIRRKGEAHPIRLKGFRIVSEEKVAALSDGELAGLAKSGALALIHAHLFSLRHLLDLVVPSEQMAGRPVEPSGDKSQQLSSEVSSIQKDIETETVKKELH